MNTKPVLYHGTCHVLQGYSLQPRATGRFAQVAPVVFASEDRAQAVMFAALDWSKLNGPILSGGYGQGTGLVRYVFIPDRQHHLQNPNRGTLLEFPAQNNFEKHRECGPTEWVSFKAFSHADCKHHVINGIPDLLQTGVQVLFFEPKKYRVMRFKN